MAMLTKENAGLMDYDDLISTTHDLLAAHGGAAWVRYKLDRGINHLLIDAAGYKPRAVADT